MNKIKIFLVAAELLLSGQTFAQTTKATIQGEISSSTANGLLGGTILNNIVLSYVDWTTCSGTGGIVYWNAGTPTCLNAGTNGYTLTMVSGIPQWTLQGTLGVSGGGTNCTMASGTCLDNITGFSTTGYINRTGSGTYAFSTVIPVSSGGTAIASGTSGGVLGFTGAGTIASSGLLAQYSVVVGGGAGATPSTVANGTAGQIFQAQTSANPAWNTLSGDATITSGGAITVSASAITNSKLANANAYTFKGNPTGSSAATTDFTIGNLTQKASPVSGDTIVIADSAASGALKYATVGSIASAGSVASVNGQTGILTFYQTPQVRLTLTQGTPVTTSDVTAATAVYLEPYNGAQLTVYDGSTNWVPLTVASSTYSLPATQTQTCTLAGTITVTGCTDTSQMVVGQQVTGTNIPASDTIATIVSSTSFTLANAATGSGSTSLTFKLPPSTAYDVYAINNSGVPKMVWSAAWSGATPPTRSLQNGVYVLSATTTQRLLGSVYTSTIAGQLVDSKLCRCLSNLYNQVPRNLLLQEATSTWTYSTAAWAQVNNGTADQVAVMFTVPGFVDVEINTLWGSTVSGNAWVGVGVDSATVPSSSTSVGGSASSTTIIADIAKYINSPGIGYHYFAWLEYGIGSGTQTWYGTGGAADRIQSGMSGMVAN